MRENSIEFHTSAAKILFRAELYVAAESADTFKRCMDSLPERPVLQLHDDEENPYEATAEFLFDALTHCLARRVMPVDDGTEDEAMADGAELAQTEIAAKEALQHIERRRPTLECLEQAVGALAAVSKKNPLVNVEGPIKILNAAIDVVKASLFDVVADAAVSIKIPSKTVASEAMKQLEEDGAAKFLELFFGGCEGQAILADCESLISAGVQNEQGDADYAASLDAFKKTKMERDGQKFKIIGDASFDSVRSGQALENTNAAFTCFVQAVETWSAIKHASVDDDYRAFCACAVDSLDFSRVVSLAQTARACGELFQGWRLDDTGIEAIISVNDDAAALLAHKPDFARLERSLRELEEHTAWLEQKAKMATKGAAGDVVAAYKELAASASVSKRAWLIVSHTAALLEQCAAQMKKNKESGGEAAPIFS